MSKSQFKVQSNVGQAHTMTAHAMPNELLVIHVPDPEKNRVIKVNDIHETRYLKVIAAGQMTGRYAGTPIKEGDTVIADHATAGVAVAGLFHDNKPLHRVDMRNIIATYEDS